MFRKGAQLAAVLIGAISAPLPGHAQTSLPTITVTGTPDPWYEMGFGSTSRQMPPPAVAYAKKQFETRQATFIKSFIADRKLGVVAPVVTPSGGRMGTILQDGPFAGYIAIDTNVDGKFDLLITPLFQQPFMSTRGGPFQLGWQ